MNPRWRASPLVVFVIAVALAAVAALLLLPTDRVTLTPDLHLTLLDGRRITLGELRGRPVLVTFWATSCAPCVEELPDLIKLYGELHPRGFELIAVAMPYDPPIHVQSFVHTRQVPYTVALDVEGTVMRTFDGVRVIPAAFLIDPDGRIVDRQTGKLDVERTRRISAPYLSEVTSGLQVPTNTPVL
ncbi:MAG: TlpA family protein disulfide reductase [Gammaproteobacteria bacterium]|nr:TlpA family protein disulfide reductase [Gammaproteobacteria bacterium]